MCDHLTININKLVNQKKQVKTYKMDPIVGDFTLTSPFTSSEEYDPILENPALISTTFPRAIRQNGGYEIALKSIAHAPVKNLIQKDFYIVEFIKSSTNTDKFIRGQIELTNRFYESQSDILMEIHRLLSSMKNPPNISLYEQNGETTLTINDPHIWLEIKADMFLNRPFKHKDNSKSFDHLQKRTKRSTTQNLAPRKKALVERLKEIQQSLDLLEEKYTSMNAFFQNYQNYHEINSAFQQWKKHASTFKNWSDDLSQHKSQISVLETSMIHFKTTIAQINDISQANSENAKQIKDFSDDLDYIQDSIGDISNLQNEYKEYFESELSRVERDSNSNQDILLKYMSSLTKELGVDKTRQIVSDTSNFISNHSKELILATELTTSSEPIITTRLGLIYSNIVDNSLLNNKQSRLLATFPIISKRGYNIYEFKNLIYKTIATLEFSTITFSILDTESLPIKFNLIGDELSNYNNERKRKYPTFLNLHIRKRL